MKLVKLAFAGIALVTASHTFAAEPAADIAAPVESAETETTETSAPAADQPASDTSVAEMPAAQ
ncbi:hypothetical protein [Acinetobacter rudis]|uniref:Uncharacterized protein n=1 Tax=Acinetobacter rudis TaxID=632955 RepID=A0AAW8J9L4_9GAMM|nr:hypothetical protein [Acinetobacter rudis]MDQ8936871.1 hypothetical protein [Acinetobacter rudis]MDQ8954469.1 hypothetical protein [Acinetobacter rudis]MDQ9019107.1 hypothetical protein [Acinetobacter rudis]